MKTFYVYILLCSDGTYYVGMTSNIELRIYRHDTGYYEGSYTSTRLPVKLMYYEEFPSFWPAMEREKQLKKWSSKKKNALIEKEYPKLRKLAKKDFKHRT